MRSERCPKEIARSSRPAARSVGYWHAIGGALLNDHFAAPNQTAGKIFIVPIFKVTTDPFDSQPIIKRKRLKMRKNVSKLSAQPARNAGDLLLAHSASCG
jgi:hypothetical protein